MKCEFCDNSADSSGSPLHNTTTGASVPMCAVCTARTIASAQYDAEQSRKTFPIKPGTVVIFGDEGWVAVYQQSNTPTVNVTLHEKDIRDIELVGLQPPAIYLTARDWQIATFGEPHGST